MIISIRGTHGSGKSTIMAGLLQKYLSGKLTGLLSRNRPEAYRLIIPGVERECFILGPYETACGGCDAVQPYDLILDLLAKYVPVGHVLFEGALVSSSHGRVGAYMDQFGRQSVMAFLDTPLQECIERIKRRRLKKGDERPLNTKNTEGKHKSVERHREKVLAWNKVRAVDIDHANAEAAIVQLLREAGDDRQVFEVRTGAGSDQDQTGTRLSGAVDERPHPEQV